MAKDTRLVLLDNPLFREQRSSGIKAGAIIPLLPRHKIDLQVLAGDGHRFARLFRATWKRVPLGVRRLLLGYWKSRGLASGVILTPFIELSSYSLGRRTLGSNDRHGHRFRFRAKYVDRMPENVVQDLIAHELAHAVQSALGIHPTRIYADGRTNYAYSDGTDFGGNYEIEEDADILMAHWGFDPESIDEWSRATGLSRVVEAEDNDKGWAKILRRMERQGR